MDLDETWNISDGPWCAFTQKWGKSPRVPKCVFFCHETSVSVAFQPLILHRFRLFLKQKTWIGMHLHTPVKNSVSVPGFSRHQKQLKGANFEWVTCDQDTAQTARFLVMGIISRASRHPKDVTFVCEFWWGTYGLCATSPRKTQNLAICAVFFVLAVHDSTSLWTYIVLSPQIHCSPSSLFCAVVCFILLSLMMFNVFITMLSNWLERVCLHKYFVKFSLLFFVFFLLGIMALLT